MREGVIGFLAVDCDLGFPVSDDPGKLHFGWRRLARILCGICAGVKEPPRIPNQSGARDRT